MRVAGFRQYLTVGMTVGLVSLGQAWAAPADMQMHADAQRIVSQYKAVFNKSNPRRLGMQVAGGTPSRTAVDGPLLGNGDLGVVIGGPPEAQHFYISKADFWRFQGGHRKGGGHPFGSLDIKIPALAGGTYLVEQELYPAITTSRFTKGQTNVTMRSWVAATDNVLIVELSAAGTPADVEVKLWADKADDTGRKDAVLWVAKSIADDRVEIPVTAACGMAFLGAKEPAFKLQPGQTVTVAVAMQSSFDSKKPLEAAQEKALGLNEKRVEKLRERHAQWWRDFWTRSLVEIGDPVLEQRYPYKTSNIVSSARNCWVAGKFWSVRLETSDERASLNMTDSSEKSIVSLG
ncbi:MAG: hypothetical protein WCJ35_08420 [Planctomycetota bacterium]